LLIEADKEAKKKQDFILGSLLAPLSKRTTAAV
jgi:hypothetical protein